MKKVLLALTIVGMFIVPIVQVWSTEAVEKTANENVGIHIPVAEYGDTGYCTIVVELLSGENYKIHKVEVELMESEKRIIDGVKELSHFSINGIDGVDFSGIDSSRDCAVQDGNVISIYLTDVKGGKAKVRLYTNEGTIYREIPLKHAPKVKVTKPSFPINTRCIITYPGQRATVQDGNVINIYSITDTPIILTNMRYTTNLSDQSISDPSFSWTFDPPYPWGWKGANPSIYINYVHVDPSTGEFDLYCPAAVYEQIDEWCGVSDNYPWLARTPPFDCFLGWTYASVYVKGSTVGNGYVSVSLRVKEYDLNGNYLRDYYKKIWSCRGYCNFDKTVGGLIWITWRDDRAYRSEVEAFGDSPDISSYASIDEGKFNFLWWFGVG